MTKTINNIARISLLVLVMAFMAACGKDDDENPKPGGSAAEVLVTYPWKLVSVTDVAGNEIAKNKLDAITTYLFNMNFTFAANNTVKALDHDTGQVNNGGTWYLKENNSVLDIDVSGFKGTFGVKGLSNSKMSLQNTLKVSGTDQEGILVFEPVVN